MTRMLWASLALGIVTLVGCSTSKRQMRMDHGEEIPMIPPHLYTSTPDIPRDQPLLTPKSNMPTLGPGGPGMGTGLPPITPGGPQGLGR